MSAEWYFSSTTGRQEGPVTVEELRHRRAVGQLAPTDLVWQAGMSTWAPAESVPELGGVAAAAPVLAPAPPISSSAAPIAATAPVPAHRLAYSAPASGQLLFTARAMELLMQTRPWARLFGVVLYIVGSLALIGGFVIVITAVAGGEALMAGMAFFYILFSALYIVPGHYLNRYATHIGQLARLRREDQLEAALAAQKSFWKFCGIAVVCVIGLYLLIFVVAIVAGGLRMF